MSFGEDFEGLSKRSDRADARHTNVLLPHVPLTPRRPRRRSSICHWPQAAAALDAQRRHHRPDAVGSPRPPAAARPRRQGHRDKLAAPAPAKNHSQAVGQRQQPRLHLRLRRALAPWVVAPRGAIRAIAIASKVKYLRAACRNCSAVTRLNAVGVPGREVRVAGGQVSAGQQRRLRLRAVCSNAPGRRPSGAWPGSVPRR